MKKLRTITILASVLILFSQESQARRRHHHKFKDLLPVYQILKLNGTITNNGKPAPEFSGVRDGDVLETEDRSYAAIRIPGLGIFRLGPKTKVIFAKFFNRDKSRIELVSGEMLCLYRRSGDHEFVLPHATVSVQDDATFFASTLGGDQTDEVCGCDGKIQAKVIESKVAQVAAPEASPTGSPPPSPTATATANVSEFKVNSQWMHKLIHIHGSNIVELHDNGLLKRHPDQIIKELESLYALP